MGLDLARIYIATKLVFAWIGVQVILERSIFMFMAFKA